MSPQYHVIYDDDLTTFKATSEIGEIKLWKGLSKNIDRTPLQIKFSDKDTFNKSDQPAHSLAGLETLCIDVTGNSATIPESNSTSAVLPSKSQASNLQRKHKQTPVSPKQNSVPQSQGKADSTRLATGTEHPQTGRTSRVSEGEFNSSEGALQKQKEARTKRLLARNRGKANPLPKQKQNKHIPVLKRPKRKEPTPDPSPSRREATPARRKRARRISKRLLRQKRLTALAQMAEHLHQDPIECLKVTVSDYFATFASLNLLDNNQINQTHPLAYAAGKTSANPNILSHSKAMKAPDKDLFIQAMVQELLNMNKKKIIKVIPKHSIPRRAKILRSVWSHRRKTKPTGEIYQHRSRICADGSVQVQGINFQ